MTGRTGSAGQEALQQAATRVVALRDELRLKAHLAGMEARDQWDAVRPQLESLADELGASLRRGADEAQVKLHLGLMELRDRWSQLEVPLLGLLERARTQDGERLRELFHAAREAIEGAGQET